MDKNKLNILKQNIEDNIRKSAEGLYLDILKTIESTLNDTAIETEPDTNQETDIEPDQPPKLSAIELANQQEQYSKDDEVEVTEPDITAKVDNIKELKLNNKGGVNEDNKANRKALEKLQVRQEHAQANQNGQHFKTIEAKKNHILKIVDHQFKRQEPINNKSFKDAVISYGLMKDEEYEETMLAFTVDGIARAVNGDNWFFMKAPIPTVENKNDKEEEHPVQSPISGITPVRATSDNDEDDDDYEDDYIDEEPDEYDDGEITNTEEDDNAEPVIKW